MWHGRPAKIEDYPYLVFLGNYHNFCAGAIISRHYVLTAAHCVRLPKDQLFIRAGSSSRTEGGSRHQLDTVVLHEKFDVDDYGLRSTHDIAVVRVKEPFIYDATRKSIPLFNKTEKLVVNADAKAAGWGKNEYRRFPDQFSKLDFHIVDAKSCNESFKSWGGLLEGQFCATSQDQENQHFCHGDSGSPLSVGGRLAGVTIYGGGCEKWDSPGVYTEVAYFRDWIDQQVSWDD